MWTFPLKVLLLQKVEQAAIEIALIVLYSSLVLQFPCQKVLVVSKSSSYDINRIK